jgi:hypothetical protein
MTVFLIKSLLNYPVPLSAFGPKGGTEHITNSRRRIVEMENFSTFYVVHRDAGTYSPQIRKS